jgi:hypothetical protein
MPMICQATGFFASALVLVTFPMKDMRMLRIIAIFSNVAFISYGALDWLLPVLSLHLLLLPLNLLRLKQIQKRAGEKLTAHRELISQPQLTLRSGCSRHFLDRDEGSRRPRHRRGRQCIRQIHSSATRRRIDRSGRSGADLVLLTAA